MTTTPATSQIDNALAHALRRIRDLERAVKAHHLVTVRFTPRTRIPGPCTYAHYSVGQLAAAALAGAVMYEWSRVEEGFFKDELARRGYTQAVETWTNSTYIPAQVDDTIATPRFTRTIESLTVLTKGGIDNLAAAFDEVILGGDGKVPGALSPAEVIDDLHATGADPAAIEAYEAGVGTSPVSPNHMLDIQADEPILDPGITATATYAPKSHSK